MGVTGRSVSRFDLIFTPSCEHASAQREKECLVSGWIWDKRDGDGAFVVAACGDQVAISINIGRDAYLQERPQLGAPVSKFRRVG